MATCAPPPTGTCAGIAPEVVDRWMPLVASVEGRFVAASNATLLGVTDTGERVVYKPVSGEAPLWDFAAESLASREVLTYELSEALGLRLVPETVLGEGPFGIGSIQRFVETEPGFDPLPMVQHNDPSLWDIAVLDIVCNNADRKLGHILRGDDGKLVAIDHGLTFHHHDKLRTVLWGFAGATLPPGLVARLEEFAAQRLGELAARITAELGIREGVALERRVESLLLEPRHPLPPQDRPALPWPPY